MQHNSITEEILCKLSPNKNGGIGISKRFVPIFKEQESENPNYRLMTPDKKHLDWIYNRLVKTHKENPHFSFMIKFHEIINQAPQREISRSDSSSMELIYNKMLVHNENQNYDYMLKFRSILNSAK